MLLFQAILMFIAIPVISSGTSNAILIVIIATLIGFNYGTNLSFPLTYKGQLGVKNFGINYGIVFTAWGVGGFVMGRLSQMLQASSGNYNSSFITAGILLIYCGDCCIYHKRRKKVAGAQGATVIREPFKRLIKVLKSSL
jgi:nitrate/nitrite transporter NarK